MISSHVKISVPEEWCFDPLTKLKFVGVWSKHLRIFFGRLRQSSVIFGKCPEIFGKCSETFVRHSGQFWKIFGNLRKMVGNLRKIVTFYIIKRKLHGRLEIRNFSSHVENYFTRSLRSLVKYFSTLEDKFRISARPCNILYTCISGSFVVAVFAIHNFFLFKHLMRCIWRTVNGL